MKFGKEIPLVIFFTLAGLLVPCSKSASLSIYEQKKYKQLIEGQGLYGADDDVYILTVHNFKEQIYGQKHAVLVEFYNSWCGFCQRFAPSWKALASDVRGWKKMVKIAALDCSDDDNSPVCRDFEIMAYPTLRYFHEDYTEGPKRLGADVIKGDDVNAHRTNLVQFLMQEQLAGRGKQFPNLLPYTYPSLNHLFDDVPLNTKYVFLILENSSVFGPEVALDLKSIPQIAVKYTNYSQIPQALQITTFPAMIVLSDDNKSHQFASGLTSRESLKMAILKFLKQTDVTIPEQESRDDEIYTGKWINAQVPDMNSLIEARERKAQLDRARAMGDVIFQMDLETALRNALKHDIGTTNTISGEKHEALVRFLDVLGKYFPFGTTGHRFLIELKENVESTSSISGKQVKDYVENVEKTGHVFSTKPLWLACEGSIAGHRGYPCGLWKLFHFLTVNAIGTSPPSEVLLAMHGFIKNFFGCADCSQHFQDMAKRRGITNPTSHMEVVLWLWAAHNEVNNRLAGDATEDPQFPKIQFPDKSRCPSCRNAIDGTWNQNEVYMYLRNMYSNNRIEYLGVDVNVLRSNVHAPPPHTSGSLAFLQGLDTNPNIYHTRAGRYDYRRIQRSIFL